MVIIMKKGKKVREFTDVYEMHEYIKYETLAGKLKEINFTCADLEKMYRMMKNIEKFDSDIEKTKDLLQRQQEVMYFIIVIFEITATMENITDIINIALTKYLELF